VYGHARLASVRGSTRTWYGTDALGSVRQTLDDAGGVATTTSYDPWGVVTQGAVATFGFTGELQQNDAVYLRARWYQPSAGTLLGRDPWFGSEEAPQTLSFYTYTHNNPVNFTDATGMYRCDVPPGFGYPQRSPIAPPIPPGGMYYWEFCNEQRARLDQEHNSLMQSTTSLGALIMLFGDSQLPAGKVAQQRGFRMSDMTEAAERLEFVLWYTWDAPFTHFRVEFNDEGFADQFRDSALWPESGNQVGHFLTAVDIAYRLGRGQEIYNGSASETFGLACIVGHELEGDRIWFAPPRHCYTGASDQAIANFAIVMAADLAGDYVLRDCYLRLSAPGVAETPSDARVQGDSRYGNSIQDLRLSSKGWIFGWKIRTGAIRDLPEAKRWLRANLGPQP
jgi:RHS repeat-associated protein